MNTNRHEWEEEDFHASAFVRDFRLRRGFSETSRRGKSLKADC